MRIENRVIMNLSKLLKNIDYLGYPTDVNITSITHDSRKVKHGSLFIALKGEFEDGYKYINDAINNGAVAILANSRPVNIKSDTPILNVSNVRQAMAKIACNFFDNPSEKINLIGVTGTNGKTSVCYLINHILNDNNFPSGSIGTLGYINSSNIISTGFTTPESIDLQQILDTSVKGGLENIVMEVSSHSIAMHRVDGLNIDIAIFTNLTPEHLDFHKTMENYLHEKQKMFTRLDKNSDCIINIDDDYSEKIVLKTKANVIKYGLSSNADVYPINYNLSGEGLTAQISIFKKTINISTTLFGKYNLYNILAAISAASICGVSPQKIESSLNKPISIPGRLEMIYNQRGKTVVIDYAHTPDAFENVLHSIAELKYNKIITVFGCGGNRDVSKRAPMGKIAEKYSDEVVITSDNPRTENLNKIIDDILIGFQNNNHIVIPDRNDALRYAINNMKRDSILLVLGKGVENYQEVNGEKIPYNEKKNILKVINES